MPSPAKPPRPRVFVGSSTEGLPIAQAIQVGLDHDCEIVIWSQGVFGLSRGTLETLADQIGEFDFAILVMTPDDMVESRGESKPSARDNVLIELGLCIGKLGRSRTFAVFDRAAGLKMPSDLAGVTLADFETHSDGNLQASVGAACTRILDAIRKQHVAKAAPPTASASPAPTPQADKPELSQYAIQLLLAAAIFDGDLCLIMCGDDVVVEVGDQRFGDGDRNLGKRYREALDELCDESPPLARRANEHAHRLTTEGFRRARTRTGFPS